MARLGPLSPDLAHQAANRCPRKPTTTATLASARLVSREDLAHLAPVTDEHNIFPYLMARSHLRTRSVLSKLPPHLLIN